MDKLDFNEFSKMPNNDRFSNYSMLSNGKDPLELQLFSIANPSIRGREACFDPSIKFKWDESIPGFSKHPFESVNNISNQDKRLSPENTGNLKKETFDSLFFCMKKVIKEEELNPEDFNISLEEKIILIAMINKKLNETTERNISIVEKAVNEQNPDAVDQLNKLIKIRKSRKRAEERYKFVFKMTLNRMRENFFEINNLKKKKTNSERSFWEFHFSDFCKKNDIPLEYVFDPLNAKLLVNKKFKCLNFNYFRLLFSNDKFRSNFFIYIDRALKEDYFKMLQHKLKKMFLVLEKKFEKGEDRMRSARWFVEQKVKKRGCKLPWSNSEIDKSREYFKRYIEEKVLQLNHKTDK